MSYDVYWVKNRAEKIADFEHPTFQGDFLWFIQKFDDFCYLLPGVEVGKLY